MPDVSHDVLEERRAADVVTAFLVPEHTAESATGRLFRLCLAHAGAQVFSGHRLEMKRHLLVHVVVACVPGKERDQAADEPGATSRHVKLPARSRTARELPPSTAAASHRARPVPHCGLYASASRTSLDDCCPSSAIQSR